MLREYLTIPHNNLYTDDQFLTAIATTYFTN